MIKTKKQNKNIMAKGENSDPQQAKHYIEN